MFLDTLDDATVELLKEWIAPATLREVTYDQIFLTLDEKITPAIYWLVHYSAFVRRTQREGETGTSFMSDFKKLATTCGFNTATNRVVLGQFVYGLRDHVVQAKLIERFATISATDALTAVQSAEQSRIDSAAVRG